MDFKIDRRMMLEMKETFKNTETELEETLREVASIAQMIEGGGLIGDGGNEFIEALQTTLTQKVRELCDKALEFQNDIQAAIDFADDANARIVQEAG